MGGKAVSETEAVSRLIGAVGAATDHVAAQTSAGQDAAKHLRAALKAAQAAAEEGDARPAEELANEARDAIQRAGLDHRLAGRADDIADALDQCADVIRFDPEPIRKALEAHEKAEAGHQKTLATLAGIVSDASAAADRARSSEVLAKVANADHEDRLSRTVTHDFLAGLVKDRDDAARALRRLSDRLAVLGSVVR